MAIQWNWNEKCGTATFMRNGGQKYNANLYVGNCFLIMLNEWEEDGNGMYSLNSFFVDADHMKRCLEDGIFSGYDTLISVRINKAKCRNYKKIVALLAEYLDNIDISVYKDGEYTWKEYAEAKPTIPEMRMREIAEVAVNFIWDNDMFEEFNDDIDFTATEKNYFGIYDNETEDEDYEDF